MGERSSYNSEIRGLEMKWMNTNLLVSSRQQPGRREGINLRHEQGKNL